jgi:hypothetical protein
MQALIWGLTPPDPRLWGLTITAMQALIWGLTPPDPRLWGLTITAMQEPLCKPLYGLAAHAHALA